MKRGHGLTLGVLAALVIAVSLPRPVRHAAPPVSPPPPAESGRVQALGPDAARGTGAARERSRIGFRSQALLLEHFRKHGRDFGAADAESYLALAQALRDRQWGPDVFGFQRPDGVMTRFDRVSGAFIAFDDDLVIRTFFKPHDGVAYFVRQSAGDAR